MQSMSNSISVGKQAELQACQFLQTSGLFLLEQNFKCPMGEIDLIMQDKDEIVFIEVRLRSNLNYGDAVESVSQHKQKKILKTANLYLQKNNLFDKVNCRFDIIGIHPNLKIDKIEWIKNAFELDTL